MERPAGETVEAYGAAVAEYAARWVAEEGWVGHVRRELAGRVLVCDGPPMPCHGHVLAAVANGAEGEVGAVVRGARAMGARGRAAWGSEGWGWAARRAGVCMAAEAAARGRAKEAHEGWVRGLEAVGKLRVRLGELRKTIKKARRESMREAGARRSARFTGTDRRGRPQTGRVEGGEGRGGRETGGKGKRVRWAEDGAAEEERPAAVPAQQQAERPPQPTLASLENKRTNEL